MKKKIQYFPFALLIGLSFNSFAGSHQQPLDPKYSAQRLYWLEFYIGTVYSRYQYGNFVF